MQSYQHGHAYTGQDRDLLTFVGQHIATALSRARALEETRQRNAELAIVNEIGQALARQLDFEAITELVGERIRSIFETRSVSIALYDEATNLISWPYEIDEGTRAHTAPFQLGPGLTSIVIRSREPLLIRTHDEAEARGAIFGGGSVTESWLGVPILTGDRVVGVIVLESTRPHAFSDGDARLLSTLAASMGVALENARLFDETKRLLAETDQRAAELALVNEIGMALAKQLDFQAIIELVGERLVAIFRQQAHDLFIALHDRGTGMISFPFDIEAGARLHRDPIPLGRGLTSIVIDTKRPLRLGTAADQQASSASAASSGRTTESWLGAPIPAGDDVIGVVAMGNTEPGAYSEADERLVSTIAASMGVALENARLFDETKRLLAETDQRAAELALVNEIGMALAEQLDFDAIIELVGERIRGLFDVSSISISLYDPKAATIAFPYVIDEGQRVPAYERPFGEGLNSTIIRERRPLLFGKGEDADAAGAIVTGTVTESWLGVPILVGDDVMGVVALEDVRQDAFDQSDLRVLSTIASSMGVALDNARLFDETKRLLTEADQRAAELAIVNEIGLALAQQLDYEAVIELVGDRLHGIFKAQARDIFIALVDRAANELRFPYWLDAGRRLEVEPGALGEGLTSIVVNTKRPLRLGTLEESLAMGAIMQPGMSPNESWLGVPIPAWQEVIGVIGLRDPPRHSFTEADERLVSTIAASTGVALENARLFDETKRLLTETDQRAAELAIINGVQQGLAGQLDTQAMYDLVGDKIQEIFDAQVVDIATLDRDEGLIRFQYTIERGVRFPNETMPYIGLRRHVLETGQPLLINRDAVGVAQAMGQPGVISGEAPRSAIFAPLHIGGVPSGVISLQNLDREHAFSEADVRLLTTLAGSLSVALENARLFEETRQRAAEFA
ncbi:MAG TPA: GAF domain-containing protein, partial [Candidatus Dormibacteraeota bacterium]|nr:GAF domain-containing protein [Candidatus Dormibacteraeota bacterium]